MSQFLKSLCKKLGREKIAQMCDVMQSCDYERELLLDWLCPPHALKVDNFVYSDRNNYLKRIKEIECRVENFIRCNDFIDFDLLLSLYRQECNK